MAGQKGKGPSATRSTEQTVPPTLQSSNQKSRVIQEAKTVAPASVALWSALFMISFGVMLTGIVLVVLGHVGGDTISASRRGLMKYGGIACLAVGGISCVLSVAFFTIAYQRNTRRKLLESKLPGIEQDLTDNDTMKAMARRTRDPTDVDDRYHWAAKREAEVSTREEQRVADMFRASEYQDQHQLAYLDSGKMTSLGGT